MDIYIINRTDRPERRAHAMEQLSSQGLNARVIPAIVDKIGWVGCRKSHLACMVHIYASGKVSVVFEDDVLFVDDIQKAQIAMMELPQEWDMLYLGGSPQEPQEQFSDHLYIANNVLCAHAIVWNPREGGAVDYILDRDEDFFLGRTDGYVIGKWDVFLIQHIQKMFNCFMTKPLICTQKQFQSDTCKRSDVSTIVRNYQKYCK